MKTSLVTILPPNDDQLRDLAKVYKNSFGKHNIFKKPLKDIIEYLEETQLKERKRLGGFVVITEEDKKLKSKVVGGVLIKRSEPTKSKHERWKISHLAVDSKNRNKGYATMLVDSIKLDAHSAVESGFAKSIKLEVSTVDADQLFRIIGFQEEGKLHDHYRLGETAVQLGMTIKK